MYILLFGLSRAAAAVAALLARLFFLPECAHAHNISVCDAIICLEYVICGVDRCTRAVNILGIRELN